MSDAMQRNQVPEVTEGYAVSVYPVRWKSYKPDHTRRTGQKGRWQRMTEYCGWENCREAPTVVQSGPEIFNAAPDMLEALERNITNFKGQRADLDFARAAIAKAKGEPT